MNAKWSFTRLARCLFMYTRKDMKRDALNSKDRPFFRLKTYAMATSSLAPTMGRAKRIYGTLHLPRPQFAQSAALLG
jgi:hypothetical protein